MTIKLGLEGLRFQRGFALHAWCVIAFFFLLYWKTS